MAEQNEKDAALHRPDVEWRGTHREPLYQAVCYWPLSCTWTSRSYPTEQEARAAAHAHVSTIEMTRPGGPS